MTNERSVPTEQKAVIPLLSGVRSTSCWSIWGMASSPVKTKHRTRPGERAALACPFHHAGKQTISSATTAERLTTMRAGPG